MEKSYQIVLGERTFTIDAPLTFKQLRIVEPAISKIIELRKNGVTEQAYDEIANVILSCVMRKNPEFTRNELDNTQLLPGQVITAFQVIGIASGLMREKTAEDEAVGEAKAETVSP